MITVVACTALGYGRYLTTISSSWTFKSVSVLSTYSLASFSEEQNTDFDNVGEALAPESSLNLVQDGSFRESIVAEVAVVNGGYVKSDSKLERLEASLAKARSSIMEAAKNGSMISMYEDLDYVPRGPIYKNANAFHRSYLEMEKLFKIYVYEEGEPPMFNNGPCKSVYSTEGRFTYEMKKGNFYRTNDLDEAHVYFLPFSVVVMVQYLHEPGAHGRRAIGSTIADYIGHISRRHRFWN